MKNATNTISDEISVSKLEPRFKRSGCASILFPVLFILLPLIGRSATFYCRANGNWTNPSIWSTISCTGGSGSTIPGAGDDVVICTGRTVTMNGTPGACFSLTVNGTVNWTSALATTNVGAGGLILNNGSSLTSTSAGTLNVSGPMTVATGATVTLGGINLIVAGVSTLNGTLNATSTGGSKSFTNFIINAGASFSSTAGETYSISSNLTMNGGTLVGTSTGIFNVAGNFIIPTGATATVGNIALTITGLTSISGTLVDNSTGGSNTFGNVDLNLTGKFNNTSAETYTITGNLNTYGGDFIGTSTATFNVAGDFNVVSGVCDMSRLRMNVLGNTVVSGTLDVNSTRGAKMFNNFTVTSTGFFNSTVSENYTITGNILVDGVFNANLGIFTLTGPGKTISGTTSILFDDITCNGSYLNNATVRLTSSLRGTGSWTQGVTGMLNLTITNTNFTISTFNAGAAGNTVIYSLSGTQSIVIPSDGKYSNLSVTSGSTKTLVAATFVGANLSIASATTLASANNNLTVGGNFLNSGTFTAGAASVTLNGGASQVINGSSITTFNNLTINNSLGVTLGINTIIQGVLNFTAGVITTLTNKVTITTGGSVTGAGTSKFVNGFLEKNISFGAAVARTFEIGFGSTDYLPVNLVFNNVTVSGNITAKANNGDHPNVLTSVIDGLKSVNRYWSLSNSGVAFANYSATCNFIGVPADADAGSLPANYYMSVFNSGNWTFLTRGSFTATANQGIGISAIGDLAVGERKTASVAISVSPSTIICSGSTVTYTAVPTNGGLTPSYQWKVNGVNVGVNSSTYSSTTLTNGQTVTCIMTSSLIGVLGNPATSNSIVMTVNPGSPVSIGVTSSPSGAICSGTNVVFSATPTNGGLTPSYQWKLNGVNVGTSSSTYSNSALANGDVITCVLTSSAACATGSPATSGGITLSVNPNLPVSVSITSSPSGTICSGTNVMFSATPTNGGLTPLYQWKLNGANVGTGSSTYSNAAVVNGDLVTCVLSSSAACATGSPATSGGITMSVTPNLPVSVSIASSALGAICSGTNVTFSASPTNGGLTPSYQWKLNGVNVGASSSTYSSATLVNGDVINCVLTSSAACVTGSPVTSGGINMSVIPNLPVSVSITASPSNTICSGTNVTFSASPTNGGLTPSYQWKLNGANVGTSSSTYSNATLVNGDVVTCALTSNATCATGSPASSGAITMSVTPNLPVSVSITASPSGAICSGTNVTFNANPINGGLTPSYEWKLNGVNVSTSSSTYSNSALVNGDVVSCVLASSAACVISSTATSNAISASVINPGTWLGVLSNDWSIGANWCGGVPVNSTNVVVPAGTPFSPILTNASICNNMTINSGATLDLSGFTINVKGNWNNDGVLLTGTGTMIFDGIVTQNITTVNPIIFNNLTINNSAGVNLSSGSFNLNGVLTINNGNFNTLGHSFTMTSTALQTARIAPLSNSASISGNFTIQRYISARDSSYSDLSSPVQSTTFNDWDDELPGISYAYSPPYTLPSAYTYNETSDAYIPVTSSSKSLTPGKGFEIFLSGDYSYGVFPNTTIDVKGVPNQGNQNFSTQISNNSQGWNLVGNPFASSISWASVYAASGGASSGLYDYIEMYDHTTGDWQGFSSSSGIEIASSQGFWVYGLPGATSLTLKIPESSKTISSNSAIKSLEKKEPYFSLTLLNTKNNLSHTFKVLASVDAKNGLDVMDVPFRQSPNKSTPQLYSILEGKKININAFDVASETYDIPLKTIAGTVGKYKIVTSGIDFVDGFNCIQLIDQLKNLTINLTEKNEYEFELGQKDSTDRFILRFSKSGDCKSNFPISKINEQDINDIEISSIPEGNLIRFNFEQPTSVHIEVVNILGQRFVESRSLMVSSSTEKIILPYNYTGMYLVKVSSEKAKLVKQFIKSDWE